MNSKNPVENQMNSSLCSLKSSFSWTFILVSCLVCVSFLGSLLLSILITSLGLILSTLFFIFSNQKPVDKSIQHESLVHGQESLVLVSKHHPKTEPIIEEKKESQENRGNRVNEIQEFLVVNSPDLYSESESNDQSSTSEDSDWPGNAGRSPDYSDDGSISDEESLIEIALPSGHYVSSKEEGNLNLNSNLNLKYPSYISDNIFGKNELMELLAEMNEMNEEDNLIEIDISMGLIKCSRFEIEA